MAIQRVGHTSITDKRGSYRQCNHYGRDTVCGTERILVVSGNNILKLSPWKTPCLALVTTHLIFILVLCKATHLIFIYKKTTAPTTVVLVVIDKEWRILALILDMYFCVMSL